MSKYFGTDGFRGNANTELTVEHAFKIGRFIGWYYGREKAARIVIGKDTRISGDMLEAALTAGITASGADAYLLPVIMTPGVAYVTRRGGFDCGVMISASHNPYHDNGIKLINSEGEKMPDDVIDEVERWLDGEFDIPLATGGNIGRAVSFYEGAESYEEHLSSIPPLRFDGLKIALDCSNGSACDIAPRVFERLGAEVHVINNTPDGININTNCGSTHIEGLQSYVTEYGMDVGFAFDGDADRCLCVDEHGALVDGDLVLYIYARYLKEHGELKAGEKVVTTIMSNFGLYKALDELGIGYEKTAVGDKYVYENMKANDHPIGGEQSGHTIISRYATTGDGTLTALMMLSVMADTGKTLSALASPVTVYPQVLKNVKVTDKDGTMADADVMAACDEVTARLSGNGRILLRKSGTEPVLRVMVEAPSFELANENVDYVIGVMDKKGLLVEVKK